MLRSLRTMLIICFCASSSMTRSGKIEIDGAVFVAARVQQQREFLHVAKMRRERCVTRGGFGVAFEHFVDVGVRHALGGLDDSARSCASRSCCRARRIP